MRFSLSTRASLAVVASGLAFATAGCFGDDEQATQGRAPVKLVDSPVVDGGRPRERALLRGAARGMEKTTLTRISIGPVQGRHQTDSGGAVPIAFTTVPGPSIRRRWDEWMVAGAFSRRLDAAGLPAQVDGTDREGGFTARPTLRGQPDPRPLSRPQENAVVKAIRAAARRSGGEIVRLEVHRPYGVAVALSLGSDDPGPFLKNKLRALMASLDAHRRRLEGLYLAVLDQRRRLALEWASWTRNPAGSYWVRRDLARCSPIAQSEPLGAEPPPSCPA